VPRLSLFHWVLLLIGLAFSVKLLGLPFLYDDNELWGYNGSVAGFGDIMATFVPKGGDALLTQIFYRPLTHLSWWLDGMLWGDWVPGYRLTNLLLHLGGAIVCGRLVLHFCERRETALFAGAVFLFHAAHLEVLGWVAARGDLIFTLFMGLGLLGYLRCETERAKLLSAACAYVAALLSKEGALVFPLWIVATDVLLTDRLRNRAAWRAWVVLAALGVGYLVVRYLAFGGLGGYDIEGGATHLSLLRDGDLLDRMDTPLKAMLIPWPGLVAGAARFQPLYGMMVLLVLAAIFVGGPRMGLKRWGASSAWFLVIAVGTYLPSVVIEVGKYLESSRVVYAGSLVAVVWLAMCFDRLVTWRPGWGLSRAFLALWAMVFGLAMQSWDEIGGMLEDLPHAVRATYGIPEPGSEILLMNDDLAFHRGLRLFSTTAAAFSRSMHPAYGRDHVPEIDWNHADAKHRFTPDYWRAHAGRLGVDLFYGEWDAARRIVIDRTEMVRQLARPLEGEVSTLIREATQIRENLIATGGISVMADEALFRAACEQRDCWIALTAPPVEPVSIEVVWRTERETETVVTGFYWATTRHPDFGDDRSLIVSGEKDDPIRARFEVPYTLEELRDPEARLTGFKIYPGLAPGALTIDRVIFRYRE